MNAAFPEERREHRPSSQVAVHGSPEFTNEVQHPHEVLPWETGTDSSILRSGARLPGFAKPGNRSGRSLQLWIARHRASLGS
jgi:hypothetical protein